MVAQRRKLARQTASKMNDELVKLCGQYQDAPPDERRAIRGAMRGVLDVLAACDQILGAAPAKDTAPTLPERSKSNDNAK